jgi:serum/glucocorticoid-regulated kinase 2
MEQENTQMEDAQLKEYNRLVQDQQELTGKVTKKDF